MRLCSITLLFALVLTLGCSNRFDLPPGVKVSGKVYLPDQSALPGGRLLLKPIDSGFLALADIQPDGSFTLLNQREAQAVVPGRYRVYVALTDTKQRDLRAKVPAKYHHFEADTSDVEVRIDAPNPQMEIRLKK